MTSHFPGYSLQLSGLRSGFHLTSPGTSLYHQAPYQGDNFTCPATAALAAVCKSLSIVTLSFPTTCDPIYWYLIILLRGPSKSINYLGGRVWGVWWSNTGPCYQLKGDSFSTWCLRSWSSSRLVTRLAVLFLQLFCAVIWSAKEVPDG